MAEHGWTSCRMHSRCFGVITTRQPSRAWIRFAPRILVDTGLDTETKITVTFVVTEVVTGPVVTNYLLTDAMPPGSSPPRQPLPCASRSLKHDFCAYCRAYRSVRTSGLVARGELLLVNTLQCRPVLPQGSCDRPQLHAQSAFEGITRRGGFTLSRGRPRGLLPRSPSANQLRLPCPPLRRPAVCHHCSPIVRSAEFLFFSRDRRASCRCC